MDFPRKRPPTIRAVAAASGYSANAVSLALRDDPQIPEATRRRIRDAAGRLGYHPHSATSELMRQIRLRGHARDGATFAVINANEQADAFHRHPTIPRYVEGMEARAREGGYTLDRLWLHEPRMRAERWLEVLKTRGIRGLIICGRMMDDRLPEFFHPVCEAFPCVSTGVGIRHPAMASASVDHYAAALLAVRELARLGYRRPALVVPAVIDDLVSGRFSAGYREGLRIAELPGGPSGPEIFRQATPSLAPPPGFAEWLAQATPDALITLYNDPRRWVEEGRRTGELQGGPVAFAQLELRTDHTDWAGIDQHNDAAGASALDQLVTLLLAGKAISAKPPTTTLIAPTWQEGPSAPPKLQAC